jgi:hypothetical protein
VSINESIDRLREALASLGFTVAAGSDDAAAWEKLDSELTPLALPADLRQLLRRVDVARLPLRTYPAPATLDFALWSWREFRDGNYTFPAGLFPWCYESHNHLFVELDGPGIDGGAMFEWMFAGSDFKLRFHNAQDWLETALAVLEEGAFKRLDHAEFPALVVDDKRWRELSAARLKAAEPHPIYGRKNSFGEGPEAWPGRWAETARLVREDPPAEYPPMTVAEVRDLRRHMTVRALVTGRPSYLVGRAGEDTRIWLQDETGALDVLCPVETRGRAAIGNVAGLFGVELVAQPLEAPRPSIDWYALAPPTDSGAPEMARLLAHQPPDATATIIHPPAQPC